MLEFPIKTDSGGVWSQPGGSDFSGAIWASFNLNVTENEGAVRLGKRLVLNTGTNDVSEITGVPVNFLKCGTHVHSIAGASGTGYNFYNDGTLTGAFSKDTTTNITYSRTTGSGLDDLTVPTPSAGTHGFGHTYIVTIGTTGTPDKFSWTKDGVSGGTGISITGSNQTLADGVVIKFGATTGHTSGDAWTLVLYSSPTKIDSTISDSVMRSTSMYVIAQNPTTSLLGFYKKVGDAAWTQTDFTGALSLSTGYPNMMTYYPQTGRIYFSHSQSSVGSIDTSDAVSQSGDYTLSLAPSGTLDSSNIITKFLPATNRIWILTVNSTGGNGYVYDWDGVSPNYNAAYRLESSGALSGVIKNDTPYIMDTNGDFLAFNGGNFEKITGFYRRGEKHLWNPVSTVNDRFIHPNGMSLVDGRIQMLIDNRNYDSASSIEEVIQSGIYEYDERSRSLVHKNSAGLTKSDGSIKDYGAVRINWAGALKEMTMPSTASGENGSLLCGFGYYSDATTAKYGIFYDDRNDTLQKAGYLVTPKIQAQGDKSSYALKNMWKHMDVVHRKLLASSDLVEIKFRTEEVAPTEFTGTWTSTTTFTTSTDLSAYWSSSKSGEEIEVLNGVGAGRCSHIASISGSGTYTVTVDQAYSGATGTFKGRAQNWKKVRSVSSQLDTIARASPGAQSSWIQFKIWMRFTGPDEIEKLTIVSDNAVPAK